MRKANRLRQMEERVTKLLRNNSFSKEFFISPHNIDMDNIFKIQNLPLENIYISEAKIKLMSDIFNTFQNLHLKTLRLSSCEIDTEVANIIANLIPGLISFGLRGCTIQSCELVTVIGAIERSHLQTLELFKIFFGQIETVAMVNCIIKSQLIKLSMTKCIFEHSQLAFESILNAISHSHSHSHPPALQTLVLCDTTFNNTAMAAIVNCIENSRIIKLHLINCTFDNNKIITIMQSMHKSSIRNLDLSRSSFDDDMEEICKCVNRSHITKFNFGSSSRHYDREELTEIATLMKENDSLKEIGFICSRLNDDTLSIICDAIENSAISTIKLQSYDLYSAQIAKICDSIKKSTITSLGLFTYNFDTEIVATICYLLENHDLKKLKLTSYRLTEEYIKEMLPSVKQSELIKFDVTGTFGLKKIKQRIKRIMRKQTIKAAAFHRMKSANTK